MDLRPAVSRNDHICQCVIHTRPEGEEMPETEADQMQDVSFLV